MQKNEWLAESGDTWAAEWRRTDRSFTQLTEQLLATLRGANPAKVLDVGCGAGELSLAIARSHPGAEVVGLDVSPKLVAAAKARAEYLGNVRFVCEDAAKWKPAAGFAPDLLISRHGVMFFDDPPAAFANLAAAAAPGARLTFSCFRAPRLNPFFTEVLGLLPEGPPPGDPYAPGPFAFADRDHVTRILEAGGWRDLSFTEIDFPMIAGAGEDAVEQSVAYFRVIGPAARAAREMDDGARARFLGRVREMAQRNCREGVVSLPAAAWIVSAAKPAI
jgi:SAM-dependent methyltransferase